jgi:glutaredoxin 3
MPEIIIYTGRLCPYCTMAKRLLDRKGVSYSEIDVDSEPNLRQQLMEKTKRRTVPQIYIGDRHIGGFDDLQALDMQKQLDLLLQSS